MSVNQLKLKNDLVAAFTKELTSTNQPLSIDRSSASIAKAICDQITEGENGYELPIATSSILGGVKIGSGITISSDGTISVSSLTGYLTKSYADTLYKPLSWLPDLSQYYTKSQNDLYYLGINAQANDSSRLGGNLPSYYQVAGNYVTGTPWTSMGYLTSITSLQITTALGFTPYNATNPAGYITSSALSGYALSSSIPNVYAWALASVKPTYTYSEVGALSAGTSFMTVNNVSVVGNGNIPINPFPGFGTTHAVAAYGDHNHTGVYQPVGSYLTSYTETDPVFTAWNKSTGISITKSQVSDFPTQLSQFANNLGNYGGFVTGTPWTTMGYLTAITSSQVTTALGSQTANMVYASPNGSAGTPTFRYLQAGDIPSGVNAYIWNQTSQQSATINVSGSVTGIGGLFKGDNYMSSPNGGLFTTTNGNFTGALTITLPASIGNTMTSMWIDVYNYVADTSFSVQVGGYTYDASDWGNNPFAIVYGADYTVRLGHNGTNFVIYIGETSTTWSYPQVSVRDIILGYNPSTTNWKNSIGISFSTTLLNVTATCTTKAWTTKNFSPSNYSTVSNVSVPSTNIAIGNSSSNGLTYTTGFYYNNGVNIPSNNGYYINAKRFVYYNGTTYIGDIDNASGGSTIIRSNGGDAVTFNGVNATFGGSITASSSISTTGTITASGILSSYSYLSLTSAPYTNVAILTSNWTGAGVWGFGNDSTAGGHVLRFDQVSGQAFQGASDITLKLGTKTVIDSSSIGSQNVNSANILNGPAHTNGTDGWFRSANQAGWFNETYSVGIYATESGNVRTYNNANMISGGYFKTTSACAMVGDYVEAGTTDKIIWTIGSNWTTLGSHYGLGYTYEPISGFGHSLFLANSGTKNIWLSCTTGSAKFNGYVTTNRVYSPRYDLGTAITNLDTFYTSNDGSIQFAQYGVGTTGIPTFNGMAFDGFVMNFNWYSTNSNSYGSQIAFGNDNASGQEEVAFRGRDINGNQGTWKQIFHSGNITSLKTAFGTPWTSMGYVTSAIQDTAHSFITNGYQKLSNGMILQWGQATANNTVYFPVSFTSRVFFIGGCNISNNNTEAFSITSLTLSSFYFNEYGKTNTGNWFAIGY